MIKLLLALAKIREAQSNLYNSLKKYRNSKANFTAFFTVNVVARKEGKNTPDTIPI